MVLGPKLLDLLDQLFFRMLNVNFVDAFGCFDSCRTPLAWLVAIALLSVSEGDLQARSKRLAQKP